jgi:hypothetical protein
VGSSRNSRLGFVSSSSLLAARQAAGAGVGVPRQGQLAEDLVNPAGPFLGARVLGEPQLGGVGQPATGGELAVQDVLLRDQADVVPQFGVVGVQVAAVVQHAAAAGGAHPGERAEQGRLAGAARADDAEQAAFRQREGDVVE